MKLFFTLFWKDLYFTNLVKYLSSLSVRFILKFTLFDFQWTYRFRVDPFMESWWAQVDSNHRPRAYQARALTTWAMSPFSFRCISFSLAFGGDDGNRTHDPLLAGQVLSQLSYTPIYWGLLFIEWTVNQNWTTSESYSHYAMHTISPSSFGFCSISEYVTAVAQCFSVTRSP